MSTTEEVIEIHEHIVDRVTKITKKKKKQAPSPKNQKAQQSMFSKHNDQISAQESDKNWETLHKNAKRAESSVQMAGQTVKALDYKMKAYTPIVQSVCEPKNRFAPALEFFNRKH